MRRDQLRETVRARIAARPPSASQPTGLRRAAVLAPLVFYQETPYLLFTQRTQDVPTHKGQMSFPGGGIENGEDEMTAALRETEEEVGIHPHQIEILGRLDEVATHSALFTITPFIGIAERGAAHITSDQEVARIIEVPLDHLLDASQRELDTLTNHWKYHWEDVVIWGATARILNQLLEVLGLPDPFAPDRAG